MTDGATLGQVLRVRVSAELLAQLRAKAARQDRSVGYVVRRAVEKDLQTERGKGK